MKKLFYLAAMLLLVVSCKSLPSQVEEFVNDVEQNHASYTDLDWSVMDAKYAEFKLEFVEKYDKLNQAEREFINREFGRYDALVAKSKVQSAFENVKGALKEAGKWVEGVVEGLTSTNETADTLKTE
jgi:phage regulator Rha-like protein